ncbi:MAG: hypothetical protein JHC93_01815 [Parachlamydiales bacterium]|nr:hypothetical protein [Parachlamydiales bacterium]
MKKIALEPGQKVLIIDDVFATGGTAAAACKLVEKLDAQVLEIACLIELENLKGRNNVTAPVFSLLSVEVNE